MNRSAWSTALIPLLLAAGVAAAFANGGPPPRPADARPFLPGAPLSESHGKRARAEALTAPAAQADTFRVAAILIEFPEDDDPATTGNGLFGDVLDANEYVYAGVFPEILDIPRDPEYFREQFRYLAQYYRKASYGRLEIVADVPETVFVAPESMAYYGDNDSATVRQAELFADAIEQADPLFDFGAYDGVVVIHAGVGEETDVNGDTPGDVWTAYLTRSDLAEAFADSGAEDAYRGIAAGDTTAAGDTIFLDRGVILPESDTQDDFPQWLLGVAAHMTGRLLGAPSLFDTDYDDGTSSQGIGNWGIMGTGLYNSGGILPPHPCAWVKVRLGWIEPTTVTRDTTVLLPPSERADSEPRIVKIPISETEYFLIENKHKDENGDGAFNFDDTDGDGILYPFRDSYEGAEFDWSLPAEGNAIGSGLLIWHIDETVIARSGDFQERNEVNADAHRKGVDLEEADGVQDLDEYPRSYDNFGSPFDAWWVSNRFLFDGGTSPSSANNAGGRTGIAIEVLSEADSLLIVSIRFEERPDGWSLPAQPGTRAVGPAAVSPQFFGFPPLYAFVYYDSAAGASFGDVRSFEEGASLQGWPLEIGGPVTAGSVLLRSADEEEYPPELVAPLDNGTVAKLTGGTGGIEILGEDAGPVDAHYLCAAEPLAEDPCAWVVSAVSRGGETVLYNRTSESGPMDTIAVLPGTATGPVSSGGLECTPVFFAATDAPLVAAVSYNGELLWSVTPAATPTPVITVSYVEEEIKEGIYRGGTAFVFAAGNRLHIRADGVDFPEEPLPLEGNASGPPAAGDLDGDGVAEIAVGTDEGVLHLFNRTGAPATGWPFRTGGDGIVGTPAIGDFDFDGEPEVVFGTEGGNLWLLRSGGEPEEGYPAALGGAPQGGVWMVAGEYENAWRTNVLVVSGRGAMDLRFFSGVNQPRIEWTGYQNGNGFAGRYAVGPIHQPSTSELLVEKETYVYPNPAGRGGDARIRYRVTAPCRVSIRIYDITGRMLRDFGEREVPAETGEAVWEICGEASGLYFARVEARGEDREGRKLIPFAVQK
ncbi:MAG: VCBS repeat-containing protein [Candidatus Eisenbacteria bacterium]|nr:VCBS repeat-containing protein [Candidatus Eisenbacteria bacterium]